jgi:hypothetical protein
MQSLVKMGVVQRCYDVTPASNSVTVCYMVDGAVTKLWVCAVTMLPRPSAIRTHRLQMTWLKGFALRQRRVMNKGWKLRSFRLTKAVVLPDILGLSTAH